MKEMMQEERLNYLVEEFKKDSGRYRNLETPEDTEGKKTILWKNSKRIPAGTEIWRLRRIRKERSASFAL